MTIEYLKRIYNKNPDVVYRIIAGEAILVPISKETQVAGRLLSLNEVGAFIWGLIDGEKSLDEIQGLISREYEVDEETARSDLLELISALEKTGAIIVRT